MLTELKHLSLPDLDVVEKGLKAPLFQEQFVPVSTIAEKLLDSDVTANLANGTPLPCIDEPFFYSDFFLSAVCTYISQGKSPLYKSAAFRENARQFAQTFGLDKTTYPRSRNGVYQGAQTYNYYETPNLIAELSQVEPPDEKTIRILMHGRFNGIPHSGYIETLLFVRDLFKNSPNNIEIWLGIDTDEATSKRGQKTFYRSSI